MERLLTVVRLLLGTVYLINGVNWFFKLITPYPSMADFAHHMPPPDIVGALIENGILFHLAKSIEVATGLALLTNRMVPLALVVAMTVTVPVCIVDVFRPEFRLRAFLMGSGSLTMNATLLLAYLHHYRPVLAWHATPRWDPTAGDDAPSGPITRSAATAGKPLMPVLAVISTVYGLVMVGWLLTMIVQYAVDPRPLAAVHDLTPR